MGTQRSSEGKRDGLQTKLNERMLLGQEEAELNLDFETFPSRGDPRTMSKASHQRPGGILSEGKTSVQNTFDGFLRLADGINRVKGRRRTNLPSLWKNQSISHGTDTRVPTTAGTGLARHISKVRGQNQNLVHSPAYPESKM